MKPIALAAFCLGLLSAQSLPTGTWVRRASDGVHSTLIIEPIGAGRKLTFTIEQPGAPSTTMIATTQLDGKDAIVSVNGKPSGQTMAIRALDDHHFANILKINGNTFATQKSELSPDGKTIKTESTPTAPGQPNTVEYWDKK